MTSRQVIHFDFQQSLSWDSGSPHWSESLQASVHLTDAALSSGWLREHFSGRRGGANDFLVLMAIVMHARPLRGADLGYLVGLGMATPKDEGRLYARVTDLGLSDELGMHRTTIAASAERLHQSGFIDIAEVPEEVEYRDSKGRFAGSKVYLLSGELQKRFLSKDIQPLPGDRVGLTDTDQVSTVSVQPSHRVGPTDINLITGGGGGDSFSADAEEKIWQLFASLKGAANYRPAPREKRLLQKLYADGYTTQEVLVGIQSAFRERTPGDPVRHFGFCVPVIRAKPPKTSPVLAPNTVSAADPDSANPGSVPGVDPVSTNPSPVLEPNTVLAVDPDSANPGTVPGADPVSTNPSPVLAPNTVSAADPVSTNPSPIPAPNPVSANPGTVPGADPVSTCLEVLPDAPPVPEQVLRIFTQANHDQPPTRTDLRRLNWLYEECAPVAQENSQDAWDWIIAALKDAAGQAHNLLPYANALIRRRKAQLLQRKAEAENKPDIPSKLQERNRKPPISSEEQTNVESTALARREIAPPRSGFVIPAEYSQASLLRALEQIPDD